MLASQSPESEPPIHNAPLQTLNFSQMVSSGLAGTGGPLLGSLDPRLTLFQQHFPLTFQQQPMASLPMVMTNPLSLTLFNAQLGAALSQQAMSGISNLVQPANNSAAMGQYGGPTIVVDGAQGLIPQRGAFPSVPSVNHDAFQVLSSLAVAGQPKITQEQEEAERASMTTEERAAALADMLGKMCAVAPRQRKRARRDLDRNSIHFLIEQMRLEIEKIPASSKQALSEAQAKSRTEEFEDARLERFLRCEGMNAEVRTGKSYHENDSGVRIIGFTSLRLSCSTIE